MAYCSNCGHELRNGAKFCDNCGTPLEEKTENSVPRRIVYEGSLHKCPNCGEILKSFVAECPACGYELRDAKASDAISQFSEKLKDAETRQEKATIINSFPVPNTKEDIWEFFILASSSINETMGNELTSSWSSKVDQTFQKAKLLFKNEEELAIIREQYKHTLSILNKNKRRKRLRHTGRLLSEVGPVLPNVIIVFFWLLSLFVVLPKCEIVRDDNGTLHQLLYFILLILGAFLIPLPLRCESALPKTIVVVGLALSMIFLITLCSKDEMYGLLLFTEIVCSIIIVVRMLKYMHSCQSNEENNTHSNSVSLIIGILSIAVFCAAYFIGVNKVAYANAHTPTRPRYSNYSSQSSQTREKKEEYLDTKQISWEQLYLGEHLPDIGINNAKVIQNDEGHLKIGFNNIDDTKFDEYIDQCKQFVYKGLDVTYISISQH